MAALQEIEHLLNGATPAELEARVINGAVVPVVAIGAGVGLVYGVFPYQRRTIGVPGRLLTSEFTHQPILAVREGDKVTPLAYAEDVAAHPLREVLVGHLKTLKH